ncbi:SMI1/KNR4 family protein [Stenotrophomonas sp. HMWF003]|uniref:SMI1/KNR4 family protein n=1 Tax=Stenotrophomonas sp. HMWF003 TaxID=2056840 RepID=UPI0015E86337|nr:SMI1/KNR4 family protein [Stenotrophomonas sp. HMWF003]
MWIDLLHELNEVSLAELVHLHGYPSLEVRLGAFTQRHPDHPMAALAKAIIAGEARWLGMPPATDRQIHEAQQRLGIELPSSYRAFLRVANGFFMPGAIVNTLLPVELITHFGEDHAHQAALWRDALDDQTGEMADDVWSRLEGTIQLSGPPHHQPEFILLDPHVRNAEGELEIVELGHEMPEYANSFHEVMERAIYTARYVITLCSKNS